MPPYSPRLDEHGFPIPATFDDPAKQQRRAQFARRAIRGVLVLVFVLLIGRLVYDLPLPDGIKRFLANRSLHAAQAKHARGDVQGALADMDRVANWFPDHPQVRCLRGEFRLEANDVQGSLDEFNEVIRLAPQHPAGYLRRSVSLQRLDRHREAIDDLTKAIELSGSDDPMPRNNRAYARALAGIELDEALVDVQQAIDAADREIQAAIEQAPRRTARNAQLLIAKEKFEKAAYLDTRGYILFLQDHYERALADIEEAIQLSLDWKQTIHTREAERAALEQRFDHELSVMYHHRGQVLEKLGRQEEAQADLDRAVQLGYNPAQGVF